jgi:hypothetical protein
MRIQRPLIRGIRLRLSLALVLVVAGVLGVVYLVVVPSLQAELVNAKLDQLEQDARTVARSYLTDLGREQDFAAQASALSRPESSSTRSSRASSSSRRLEYHGLARRRARPDCGARRRDGKAAAGDGRARRALVRGGRAPAGPEAVVCSATRLRIPLSSLHLINGGCCSQA